MTLKYMTRLVFDAMPGHRDIADVRERRGMDRQTRGARARDGRDVGRSLASTLRLGLSRRFPARAAALLALLLAALALPGPAHAQTTVWSATLTVEQISGGRGCAVSVREGLNKSILR